AHPLSQLGDERRVRHPLDLAHDPRPRQALHLCDDVQVAAALSQQDVYVPVQLERRTELALRTALAFGDRTDLAVGPGPEGETPVGLAVIELAQHDRVVAVSGPG